MFGVSSTTPFTFFRLYTIVSTNTFVCSAGVAQVNRALVGEAEDLGLSPSVRSISISRKLFSEKVTTGLDKAVKKCYNNSMRLEKKF